MIQEIYPEVFSNAFTPREAVDTDLVFCYKGEEVLMFGVEDMLLAPTVDMMKQTFEVQTEDLIYLFSIGEEGIYLLKYTDAVEEKLKRAAGFEFRTLRVLRSLEPQWIAFAGVTGSHLAKWYRSNEYCGCCGNKMKPKTTERAMRCPECGFTDYPKICPAVIVAIVDGDKIMLTKYANRDFTRYALVAGFCEIGETVEETVHREVLEEIGVKVKNIRYFGSQPWGFSESLLFGFFVDLDGNNTVKLDVNELKEGVWVQREDVPDDSENGLSLTYTMMQAFKRGEK